MLDSCKLTLIPTDVETVVKYNKNLVQSAQPSLQRELFYALSEVDGFDAAIQQFLEETLSQKVKRQGKYTLRCAWYAMRRKGKPLY